MKRRYGKTKEQGALRSVLFGIASAAAVFVLAALVMSAVAYGTSNPTSKVGIYSLLSFTLAGFASGVVTSRLKGSGGIFCALISGAAAVASIFTVRLIIGSLSGSFALSALSYLGACMLGAYFARPRARRHGR